MFNNSIRHLVFVLILVFVKNETFSAENLLIEGGENAVITTNAHFSYARIGFDTSGNHLEISNGGQVQDDYGGMIGYAKGIGNNSVLVTGSNSMWSGTYLDIGYQAASNSLVITDGGRVKENRVRIGAYAFSHNNSILVTGTNSVLESGSLSVGHHGKADNMTVSDHAEVLVSSYTYIGYGIDSCSNVLNVTDGAQFTCGSFLSVGEGGSDNTLVVSDGGAVDFSRSYSVVTVGKNAGSGNKLLITSGGNVVSSSGDIGYRFDTSDNSVLVTDVGSTWNVVQSLNVGIDGESNSLTIARGGLIESGEGYIGKESGSGNWVLVTGPGSVWNISGLLNIGGVGYGNSLTVSNGGHVNVGTDLRLFSDSALNIDAKSSVNTENYFQASQASIGIGISTNASGDALLNGKLIIDGIAEFESGSTLTVNGDIDNFKLRKAYDLKLVDVGGTLIVGGVTNPVDLAQLTINNTLLNAKVYIVGNDIWSTVRRRLLRDASGFNGLDVCSAALVADEIDERSGGGEEQANAMLDYIDKMTISARALKSALCQQYDRGTPNYQHGQVLHSAGQQVRVQGQRFQQAKRNSMRQPTGVAGPHKAEQGARGWIKGYGSWGSFDAGESYTGYDLNIYGTIIGLDRPFGDVLVGMAGGYAQSDINQTDKDSSEAKTGYGIVYASYGTVDWFGDLNFSYGRSYLETESAAGFSATGDFDADNYSMYLGGGKEIKFSNGKFLITPEVSLLTSYYDQDAYTESTVPPGFGKDVDAYDRWSYQSRLGATFALQKTYETVVIKPELRTFWLHEFNADEDHVGYSLVGGTGQYTLGIQAPVEDLLELGAGISAYFYDKVELIVDLDGQFSGEYNSYGISGSLKYEF